MKKRRELDALVGTGKSRRKSKTGHELLRNDDSGSSDVDYSEPPPNIPLRNPNRSNFCATCISILGFFLLVTCLAACGGLLWVHFELKKELDSLRDRVNSVETLQMSDHASFGKLQSMQLQIKSINDTVYKVCARKQDLQAVIKNLTAVAQQVESLQSRKQEPVTVLQTDLKELRKTVANIGSDVSTAGTASVKNSEDITKIQGNFKALQDILASVSPGRENENTVSHPPVVTVDNVFVSLNQSVNNQMKSFSDQLDTQSVQLNVLMNKTIELKQNFTALSKRFTSLAAPMVKSALQFNITELTEQMEEKLDAYIRSLIQTALSDMSNTSTIGAAVDASEFSALQKQVQELQSDQSEHIPASLNNITTTVESIVDARLENTDIRIQELDKVVKSINVTVDDLTKMAMTAQNERTEMSHQISGTQRYVNRITESTESSSSTTQQPQTEAG